MAAYVPRGMGPAGRKFWRAVRDIYELSPGEEVLLTRACHVLDRLAEIDFLIAQPKVRPIVPGSVQGTVRPNPLYAMAAEQEKLLDTLVRSLALPMPGEEEGTIKSPDQRMKAQARWRKFHEERDRARSELVVDG